MFDAMDLAVGQIMQQYGQDGFICSTQEGVYDEETSTVIKTELKIPCRLVVMDYMLKRDGNTVQYESLISQANKKIYVLPVIKDQRPEEITLKPEKDYIEDCNGLVYRVLSFKTVNPTGANPYVYIMYCKK